MVSSKLRTTLFVFDALRDADVGVVLRQIHEIAPGDADLRGQPRALGTQRVFHHLHHQVLALLQQFLDWRPGGGALSTAGFVAPDIGDVQKCRAVARDVDERGLHARQHAHHAAHVNVAHQPASGSALDVQLLHHAVFDDGDAGFLRREVDEDFVAHGLGLVNGEP